MFPLYLIDAPIYFFRAFFSVPDHFYTAQGDSLNGVVGYSHFLLDLLLTRQPRAAVAAFDESLGSCFRNDLYSPYKFSRPRPDDSLVFQFEQCKKITQLCGIQVLASSRYEADDLLASCAHSHSGQRVLVTRDKDLWQLLRQGDICWDGQQTLDYEGCINKLGILPSQIADYLALMGDAVDDIPGVPGIGKKTASVLLNQFEDIDTLYANLDQHKQWPIRGSLRISKLLYEYKKQVFLMKKLTGLEYRAPLILDATDFQCRPCKGDELLALARELGLPKSINNKITKFIAWGENHENTGG